LNKKGKKGVHKQQWITGNIALKGGGLHVDRTTLRPRRLEERTPHTGIQRKLIMPRPRHLGATQVYAA